MPTIYLSPLTCDNPVQAEHHHLALSCLHALTDALASRLDDAKIAYARASENPAPSDAEEYALHLALHTNMAHDSLAGIMRGITVLHSAGDEAGARAAMIFTEALKEVYPLPRHVRMEEDGAVGPLTRGKALPLLLALGYQDCSADAAWLQYQREAIAEAITRAIVAVLRGEERRPEPSPTQEHPRPAIPTTADPSPAGDEAALPAAATPTVSQSSADGAARRQGIARAPFGGLVLRAAPENTSPILATAPNNSPLTILDTVGDWYLLASGNTTGYASQSLVTLL